MISRSDIENLAELSRLKLTPEEVAALEKDFSSILDYVSQVSGVAAGEAAETADVHNVLRNDEAIPNAIGGTREALLEAAPERDGDYFVVRKILSKDEPNS